MGQAIFSQSNLSLEEMEEMMGTEEVTVPTTTPVVAEVTTPEVEATVEPVEATDNTNDEIPE